MRSCPYLVTFVQLATHLVMLSSLILNLVWRIQLMIVQKPTIQVFVGLIKTVARCFPRGVIFRWLVLWIRCRHPLLWPLKLTTQIKTTSCCPLGIEQIIVTMLSGDLIVAASGLWIRVRKRRVFPLKNVSVTESTGRFRFILSPYSIKIFEFQNKSCSNTLWIRCSRFGVDENWWILDPTKGCFKNLRYFFVIKGWGVNPYYSSINK